MEIGASNAPASFGGSDRHHLACVQARGLPGALALTNPWTNMNLLYLSYDVYTRKFTRKRHFARAATTTQPAAAADESATHVAKNK